jgi:hypothetical protein
VDQNLAPVAENQERVREENQLLRALAYSSACSLELERLQTIDEVCLRDSMDFEQQAIFPLPNRGVRL